MRHTLKISFLILYIILCVPNFSEAKKESFKDLSQDKKEEIWLALVSSVQAPSSKESLMKAIGTYKINEILSKEGNTILHHLVLNNSTIDEALLNSLLSKNFNINIQNNVGYTSLALSILEKKSAITQTLLKKSVTKITLKDNLGRTPLHLAVITEQEEIVKTLLSRKNNQVNKKDNNGWTPLFYAVNNKNIGLAALLIENKANVNASSVVYQTPLHLATRNNDIGMVNLLVTNKANVSAKDKFITESSSPIDINTAQKDFALVNTPAKINSTLLENNAKPASAYFSENAAILARYSFGVPFKNIIKKTDKPVNVQFVGAQINYYIKPSLSIFWAYDYGFSGEPYHFIKMPGLLAAIQQIFSLLSTDYNKELKGPSKNLFYTLLGLSAIIPQGISWDIYPATTQQWMNFSIVVTLAEANYVISKGKNEFETPFLVDISGLLGVKINFLLGQHTLAVFSANAGLSYKEISFVWNFGFSLGYLF